MITKSERSELRAIVRQQFRVLRAELDQREVEMIADVEDQIAERYKVEDQSWSAFQHQIHEIVLACNRQINDALYEHGYEQKGSYERIWVGTPNMIQPQGNRPDLRRHTHARIHAQVRSARLDLDRREADLLRTLSVGALESEEAREFLQSIPSVGELVPTARLAELEAQLGPDGES